MKKYILIFLNLLMLCDGARASGLSDCVIRVLDEDARLITLDARLIRFLGAARDFRATLGEVYDIDDRLGLITYRNIVRRVRLVNGGVREVRGTLQIRFETRPPELFFSATDPSHRIYEVAGRSLTDYQFLPEEFYVAPRNVAEEPTVIPHVRPLAPIGITAVTPIAVAPNNRSINISRRPSSSLREGVSISYPEDPFDSGGDERTSLAMGSGQRSVGIVRRWYTRATGEPVVEVEQLTLATRGEYVAIERRIVELSTSQLENARPSHGARVLAEYDRVMNEVRTAPPVDRANAPPAGSLDVANLREFLQIGVRESAVVEQHRRAIESQRFSGIELHADPIQADGSRSVNLFLEGQGLTRADNSRILRQLTPREWERLIRISEQIPVYEVEVTNPDRVRAAVRRGLPDITAAQDSALISDSRNHIFFQHYVMQASELGVRVELDPVTSIQGGAGFYAPRGSRILLGPRSTLGVLRHEFMHAAFDKTGADNIYRYLYNQTVTQRRPVADVQAEARAQLNAIPPTTSIFLSQWQATQALRVAIAGRTGRRAEAISLGEVFNHYSVPIDYALDRLLPNHTPLRAANERMATYIQRVAGRVNRDGGITSIITTHNYAGATGLNAEGYGLRWERYEIQEIPQANRTPIQRTRLADVERRILAIREALREYRQRQTNERWWWPF